MTPSGRTSRGVNNGINYKKQILVVCAVSSGPFAVGLTRGYLASAIVSMQDPQHCSGLGFSDQQISWIASLCYLGAVLGDILGGLGMQLGRRTMLMVTALPYTLAWLMTAMTNYYPMILTATFTGGFFMSCIVTTTRVYITEISVSNIRGSMTSLIEILSQVGILISFSLGSYISWSKLALIAISATALFLLSQIFIPETPSSLLLRNKQREARESLQWLRGSDVDIQPELDMIKSNIISSKKYKQYNILTKWTSENRTSPTLFRWIEKSEYDLKYELSEYTTNGTLTTKYNNSRYAMLKRLKTPLFITCGVAFFRRFTGTDFFYFYTVKTFQKTFWVMDPYAGAVAVNVVQIMTSCISAMLVDKVGRRPLLIVSGGMMFVALASFATFSYYRNELVTFYFYDSMSLVCVFAFTIASALGICPISSVLTGDLIPLENRHIGSAITSSFSHFCAFINIKIAMDIQERFGISGLFWIYAGMSLLYDFFVILYVFETKGMKIDEQNQKYTEALFNSLNDDPKFVRTSRVVSFMDEEEDVV